MSKFFKKNFHLFLLLIIIFFGFNLRNFNINVWPRLGATFDEYAWTWQGINLIQKGIPISWSPHSQYKNKKLIVYQKTYFYLVKPYLEHPPVFGLIAGSFALFNGVKDMYHVDLEHIRGLALILGVLSIFLVYIFAAEVFGYKIGLVSAFIYSIVPTVVVGSRLVENENFFIPLFLLSLILIKYFLKSNNPWFRNIAAVICGLLSLAKVPWLAAALAIFLILIYLKKYKDSIKFISIVIAIFSFFFIYGAYYDWNLFINLWKLQLQRYDLMFNSFFALFTSPFLADRVLIDGWVYFGWISIFILAIKDIKKNFMLLFPFLAYLAVYVFAIPNEPSHGWYRYPFYPFLIISISLFLKEYFNKNYFLTFLFLIFTGLSMLQLSWEPFFGFSFLIFRFFLILFAMSLLPLFFPKTNKFISIVNYISFFMISCLTIWSVLLYNEQ